jgi:hypothetical protein
LDCPRWPCDIRRSEKRRRPSAGIPRFSARNLRASKKARERIAIIQPYGLLNAHGCRAQLLLFELLTWCAIDRTDLIWHPKAAAENLVLIRQQKYALLSGLPIVVVSLPTDLRV